MRNATKPAKKLAIRQDIGHGWPSLTCCLALMSATPVPRRKPAGWGGRNCRTSCKLCRSTPQTGAAAPHETAAKSLGKSLA